MSGEGVLVERVRAALLAAGHADTIRAFPQGTRSAAEAAAAIGCDVAQIAKSIVFRAGERAVVVLASGADRVDAKKVAAVAGMAVKRAEAEFVRAATGFAIGGVSPVGFTTPPVLLMDEALFVLHPLWAAAGTPTHVFATQAEALLRITGARRADLAER